MNELTAQIFERKLCSSRATSSCWVINNLLAMGDGWMENYITEDEKIHPIGGDSSSQQRFLSKGDIPDCKQCLWYLKCYLRSLISCFDQWRWRSVWFESSATIKYSLFSLLCVCAHTQQAWAAESYHRNKHYDFDILIRVITFSANVVGTFWFACNY